MLTRTCQFFVRYMTCLVSYPNMNQILYGFDTKLGCQFISNWPCVSTKFRDVRFHNNQMQFNTYTLSYHNAHHMYTNIYILVIVHYYFQGGCASTGFQPTSGTIHSCFSAHNFNTDNSEFRAWLGKRAGLKLLHFLTIFITQCWFNSQLFFLWMKGLPPFLLDMLLGADSHASLSLSPQRAEKLSTKNVRKTVAANLII